MQKMMLIGTVGPMLGMGYTKQGNAYAGFDLTVSRESRSLTNEQEGEWVKQFFIIARDDLAERCNQELQVGQTVFLEGYLSPRKYVVSWYEGVLIEMILSNFEILLPSNPSNEGDEDSNSSGLEDDTMTKPVKSFFEPYLNHDPHFSGHIHPDGKLVSMLVMDEQNYRSAVWDQGTGKLVWVPEDTTGLEFAYNIAWSRDGKELYLFGLTSFLSEDRHWLREHYVWERRRWPEKTLICSCPVILPRNVIPVNIFVSPGGSIVGLKYQGPFGPEHADGAEFIALTTSGDTQIRGSAFSIVGEWPSLTHEYKDYELNEYRYPVTARKLTDFVFSSDDRYCVFVWQDSGTDWGLADVFYDSYDYGLYLEILDLQKRLICRLPLHKLPLEIAHVRWEIMLPEFLDHNRVKVALPTGDIKIYQLSELF